MKDQEIQQRMREMGTDSAEREKGMRLLHEAEQLFRDRMKFLSDRARVAKYYFGDQWSDKMTDPDTGETITEEDWIRSDNRVPIKNNMMNKIGRNLVGQFRMNNPDPRVIARNDNNAQIGDVMTAALQSVHDINEIEELEAREFEEFLVSAGCGYKVQFRWWSKYDRKDVFVSKLDQTRFFYNVDSQDPRMFDVTAVGEILDVDIDDVLMNFATSPAHEAEIRDKFPYIPGDTRYARYPQYIQQFRDFYMPDNEGKVRVIEYWKQEYGWREFVHDKADGTNKICDDFYWKEKFDKMGMDYGDYANYSNEELVSIINQIRIENAVQLGVDPQEAESYLLEYKPRKEAFFKAYYLTPLGYILKEMESPYMHQDHPYAFGYHPLMDGRTYSLMASIIDQQRFVNRLISMVDAGMSKGVKDLMMVPVESIPEGMSREQFAEQSVVYKGIMYYKAKAGVPAPNAITNTSSFVSQIQLLQIMQDYMNSISSVNDAMQGEEPHSNTPASLYAQRTQNAALGNRDYFQFFFNVSRRRDYKILQLMQQFYNERRYIRVAGTGFNKGHESVFDPDQIRGVHLDVVIGETQDTFAYRQTIDNYLMNFLQAGLIDLRMFLDNTTLPFADSLLEDLNSRMQDQQQQMQQMQQSGQLPPGAMPPQAGMIQ